MKTKKLFQFDVEARFGDREVDLQSQYVWADSLDEAESLVHEWMDDCRDGEYNAEYDWWDAGDCVYKILTVGEIEFISLFPINGPRVHIPKEYEDER